jgi:hypothetical protein
MKRTAGALGLFALTAALAGAAGMDTTLPTVAQTAASAQLAYAPMAEVRRAEFRGQHASSDVQHVADWSVHSADSRGLPFIIIDKVNARAYAFDRYGTLIDSTPVLIGMGVGDKFAPGVLQMDMYKTKPWQRITPAGRFFAEEDRNLQGEKVLWVDYDAGIAIHRLPSKPTKQRRHERIVSPDPAEHRITYGCINVPPAFYDRVVAPNFRNRGGYVYVLPDSMPLSAVFRLQDIAPRALTRTAAGERTAPTLQRF